MKLALVFSLGLATLAVACGSSSSSSDGATGPVAATPLKGSVDGQDFVAKIALAHKGFEDGKKSIDIYETDVACDTASTPAKREILLDVPWTAGTAKDFSFGQGASQTATFVVDKNGSPTNIISTNGRVEVVDAPTEKGATGKIRLRALAEGNKVEGEIAVKVCE